MRRRRMFLTPRWLGLHALTVVLTVTFVALGWWQFKRGEEGNLRSYAYALQWPTFALFVLFMWGTLIRHELTPPPPDQPAVGSSSDGAGNTAPSAVAPDTALDRRPAAGTAAHGDTGPAHRDTRPAPPDGEPGGQPDARPAVLSAPAAARGRNGSRAETALPRVARRRLAADPTASAATTDVPATEEPDEELAAYNRYLARLNAEAERRQP